jgi:hypothetical protein
MLLVNVGSDVLFCANHENGENARIVVIEAIEVKQ